MIGFTELALEDATPGTLMADNLQEVLIAGKRAKDLVRQILAFARQSEEKVEPVMVSAIVREALKLIRSTIPTTIKIKYNIESNSSIMGNATQIHQIIMNLCSNAAHAMEESGGILSIDLNNTHFSEPDAGEMLNLPEGTYLRLSVADTGWGISSEYLNAIFEPFFTTKGPGEGTGMGLSVVQGIVEKYGGRIKVTSEVGRGTTFNIYLPVCQDKKESRDVEYDLLELKKEKILLVDDEQSILKMNRQVLNRLGYRVTPRQSSLKALELFRNDPSAFDLVMTDMTMPNMTGDQMAKEMLKIRPDIPVILVTGYSKKINEKMAADMGVKALIFKPIMSSQLSSVLKKVLNGA
jgi:CheY-like chemotaxis protein/two-component sensor histidine kinase